MKGSLKGLGPEDTQEGETERTNRPHSPTHTKPKRINENLSFVLLHF